VDEALEREELLVAPTAATDAEIKTTIAPTTTTEATRDERDR
jgi:hypothetical protein